MSVAGEIDRIVETWLTPGTNDEMVSQREVQILTDIALLLGMLIALHEQKLQAAPA